MCYWFAHLYHYFTHIKLACSGAESTQQILLANSSFHVSMNIKPCQAHIRSAQNHFPKFCITLPIAFYIAFLASVILSQVDSIQFSRISFHMLSILLLGPQSSSSSKINIIQTSMSFLSVNSEKVGSIYF